MYVSVLGSFDPLQKSRINHRFQRVNRSPIRSGFRAGAKGIRYTVNMATPTSKQTKAERVSHFNVHLFAFTAHGGQGDK